MKLKTISFLLCLILVCPFFSCNDIPFVTDSGSAYLSFTDSVGNTVTLKKKPSKVAVLFSSYADVWVSAGGHVSITVGDSIKRGFASSTAVLVDKGSGHSSIDIETLISEAPDLVIGTADYACQVEACEKMNELGIPSALFKVECFEDYLSMLKICSDITGRSDLYTKNGTDVEDRINAIKNAVSKNVSSKQKLLFLRAGSSASSTKAKASSDNFAAAMLTELGCQNIADSVPLLLDGLSLESVIVEAPEHIFISVMGDETAAKANISSLFSKEGWNTLECVEKENYYFLPKELFHYKPNSKWDIAYEYLARILYPDIEI